MESLAYLELTLVSEAPTESKISDGLKWKHLPSQTYVRLLSLAVMLSVLSAASSAFAQIDPGNPNVRSVQDRLRDLGYFNRTSTGQLGSTTQQALINFQRDNQLLLTGRPDRVTTIAINSLTGFDTQPFRTVYANYPNYRELRFGDRGADVFTLQRRLKHLGYFNTHPTGSFREITLHAVKYFQRVNGLRVTGVADSKTLALLFSSKPPVHPVPPPDDISGNGACKGLRFGDRGATVDLIQRQLKALGYFEGKVDGKFRERTLYAVTRFQQNNHLVSDGCADTATLIAIDRRMRESKITWDEENQQQVNAEDFLGLGDIGQQVKVVQRRLQELGYYNGSIHGRFDRATEIALIEFQEDSGLFGTGRVDRSTQAALWQGHRQKAQVAKPSEELALRRGDTGPAVPISSNFNSRSSVQELQRRLRDLRFYNGPISGVFDPTTKTALARAQRSYGVSSEDLLTNKSG